MAGTTLISIKVMLTGIVVAILYMSAQKSREALGADNLSRTEDLSWQDCLDWGTGSLACAGKQVVKLYAFNIRGSYVEKAKQRAYDIALNKGITEGLAINAAREKAAKLGKEAGKLASRKHKRVTGPLIAGAWDFFEVLYYGGTFFEGLLKGVGTLLGTYAGGGLGEQRLGWPSTRVGFLVGSHIGSWLGGEVGLMVYDVCNGARLLTISLGEFLSGTTETSMTTDSTDVSVIDSGADSIEYQ
ncbi:unnamed protein product [Calypogeia fissa]